jgi:predicted dehydrogenase
MQKMRNNINNIGVIGYKNQASKIINILKKKKFNLYVYVKNKKRFANKKNIKYIEDLDLLRESCSAIFIASPSITHYKYITYFAKKKKFIFCEKPPCTKLIDYKKLNKLSNSIKKRVYFNFNYKFSPFFTSAKKILKNKIYGKPIHFSWNNSHGLAFKRKLKKSKNLLTNITGNLGIHFVNLYLNFFRTINKIDFIEKKIINKKIIDNAIINIKTKNISGIITMSYSSVAECNAFLLTTNSILKFNNGTTSLFYPRNTFDKFGNYTTPKKKIIKKFSNMTFHNNYTLLKSVNFFINNYKNEEYFKIKDFNTAMHSNKFFFKN